MSKAIREEDAVAHRALPPRSFSLQARLAQGGHVTL